ncbi:MAG: hypothetical protein HQM10_08260 [Candidatus Riflebacteria bacterium]|nr:hypothetical protein [Candidatus Riflebacteria bacterium]
MHKTKEKGFPSRGGMALFLVMGFLFFIAIVAFYLHSFSRHQMSQTRFLSNAEVAFVAAEFGAREACMLVQKTADFINSTDPLTYPKKDRVPVVLKTFFDAFFNSRAQLKNNLSSIDLNLSNMPVNSMLSDYAPKLKLRVNIKLKNPAPLLEGTIIPGVCEPFSETRGRFVIDSKSEYYGTERRVMTTFEARSINLTTPVIGRFVLSVVKGDGNLNPLSESLAPLPVNQKYSPFPPVFQTNDTIFPLVVNGGNTITDKNKTRNETATFFNSQGWVYLGVPFGTKPEFWTAGVAQPAGEYGDGFLMTGTQAYFFPIEQGSPRLGQTNNGISLWKDFQTVAFIGPTHKEGKEKIRKYILAKSPDNDFGISCLKLMGTASEPSPNLIFGKAYRHYNLEQGFRPVPKDGKTSSVALIPYVAPEDYSKSSMGVPGMGRNVAQAYRDTCQGYSGFEQAMTKTVIAPVNEGIAFYFDKNSGANFKPVFESGNIPKLGRNLNYQADSPANFLLDIQQKFFRNNECIYDGGLNQVLPNIKDLVSARSARSFLNSSEFKLFLENFLKRGKQVTGSYLIKGPFTWTSEFNQLAIGGVVIIAESDITIQSSVRPQAQPQNSDARDHTVSLVSLNGDIVISTDSPVDAALIALKGTLRLSQPCKIEIKGLLAVANLNLNQFHNKFKKSITYDSRFDWADEETFTKNVRLSLEDQPLLFQVKSN